MRRAADDDDGTDENDNDQTAPARPIWCTPYMVVSAAAAFCYVLDGALQVLRWSSPAERQRRRRARRRQQHQPQQQQRYDVGENETSDAPLLRPQLEDSRLLALGVGGAFGAGACLDFVAAVTSTLPDPQWSNWTTVGAAHAYVANALLVLWRARRRRRQQQSPAPLLTLSQRAEALGNRLFLLGALVDMSLSYVYTGILVGSAAAVNADKVWQGVYRGNLVTSVLWLVDALLYIAADVLADDEDDDNEGERRNGATTNSDGDNATAPVNGGGDDDDRFAPQLQRSPSPFHDDCGP